MIEKHIQKVIAEKGSICVDEFLGIVVPYYYANNNVFGKDGDFTTAPEISQMFGELVGIWAAQIFLKSGSPEFQIVELGPGRGTLMSDLLRATKNAPKFHDNLKRITMLETSDFLQKKQQENLNSYQKCKWQKDLEDLPSMFTIFIANEFFDALPTKQFQVHNGKLHEVMVTCTDSGNLEFCLSQSGISLQKNLPEGSIIESSSITKTYAEKIKSLLALSGGAAIIIDYGYITPPFKSTLQALYKHSRIDPLDKIGQADITYLVNFAQLENIFKPNLNTQTITQREFLLNYGIETRAKKLIENGAKVENIQAQLHRLTAEEQMGEIFKVLITNTF